MTAYKALFREFFLPESAATCMATKKFGEFPMPILEEENSNHLLFYRGPTHFQVRIQELFSSKRFRGRG
jgi:hypothetical protein